MSDEKVVTVSEVMTEQEAFRQMIESNEKRTFYARVTGIAAIIVCLIFVAAGCILIPRAMQVMDEAVTTINKAEESLSHIDTVTDELTKVAANMNKVVEDNAGGLSGALDEINKIDIETLNEAIGDLHDTVEPMAKFFNAFK